jgi:transposase
MTVGKEMTAEIRRLYFAEHWKRGTIATQLGVHPDVVVRVLGSFGPKAGTPRPSTSVLAAYYSFINETLERYPRLVSTRLFDMATERGYDGSLRTLRKYVSGARPRPKHEVFLRVETLPGEQAQVDWAHVGTIPVPGGQRALWAFVMVLAHSRMMWGELVVDLDAWSLRRSLVRASSFFGGVPRQWLFDNPKVVVVERHGDRVRFHDDLLELAASLHVQPRLCAPRKPNHKGKVERAIRFLRERFFAARSIHSVEHGNAQLLRFLETIANPRPHPIWRERTVLEVFDDERPRLMVLPDPMPSLERVMPVAADKTAFVTVDTNRYSVPSRYARGTLTVAATDTELRFLDGAEEIAKHERCWGRRQVLERHEHREALLAEKREARALKGRDRLHAELTNIDVIFDRWFENGRNIGSMVARTIKLLDLYGRAAVQAAVDEMISRGTHDPGALAMHCERHRARSAPVRTMLDLAPHVVERDVVPHDLGRYDG